MIVVVDTNVVLSARATKHRHNRILRAFGVGKFAWAVSTEIVLEYEEIIARHASAAEWCKLKTVLDAADELHSNLLHVEPSFHFRLIAGDPDDDKFADCAIAAEADWLITDDAHFEALRSAGHKPQPISSDEFIARHLSAA